MNDLFECPELLPKNIQAILSRYADLEIEKGVQYADLIKMGKEMAKNGYSFDFYLDGVPYNLQKIKIKLK
jgi:inorganic pyrophosphatase